MPDNFKKQVNPTDAEISAHYDSHKDSYKVPEQRKIKFVRVSTADIAAKIKVPKSDIERVLQRALGTYTTPEQIRASHILLKTEGKTDKRYVPKRSRC